MSIKLNITNFGYFAFKPSSPLLTAKGKKIALALTILMGVITPGVGHLISAIVYYNKKSKMNALLANIDRLGQSTIGSTSSSATNVIDSNANSPHNINLKLPKGRELKPNQVPNDEYVGTHELYGHKLYNPKGIGLTYQMLDIADRIFTEHDIQYWGHGGTILGAIRHGGHIPWDDDEDVCVGENYDLLNSKEVRGKLAAAGLRLCKTWFGYKLCPIKTPIYGKNIKEPGSEAYCWPFIDIFQMQKDEKNVYRLVSKKALSYWENTDYFPSEELGNMKKGKLGPITVPIPENHLPFLERSYTAQWATHGKMGYDVFNTRYHSTELKPLSDLSPADYVFDHKYALPRCIVDKVKI